MLKITLSAIAAAMVALGVGTIDADAQSRVFVAAQGSDANPCTFALPCRTFQHAHNTVAANGEIDVLDPAGYGAVTISKSISIQGHGFSGISVSTFVDAITISGAGTDKISLRGLIIDGFGVGRNGISITGGGTVEIQDCHIRNFTNYGVDLESSISTNLLVTSTHISAGFAGINILPSSSPTIIGGIENVVISGASNSGVLIVGSGTSGGAINFTLANSTIMNGAIRGVTVLNFSGGASTTLMVRDTTISNNAAQGVSAAGSVTVRVTRSTITGNGTGFATSSGGVLLSYSDNNLDGNTTDGAPTGTIVYQ